MIHPSWEKLPDVPFYRTTLFSIGNMLLTAGGGYGRSVSLVLTAMYIMKRDRPSADIHLFNPHMNQWLKMGELPESRMSCTCTVLPSGKLLVAGEGVVRVNAEKLLSTVYTATIIAGSYFEPTHF